MILSLQRLRAEVSGPDCPIRKTNRSTQQQVNACQDAGTHAKCILFFISYYYFDWVSLVLQMFKWVKAAPVPGVSVVSPPNAAHASFFFRAFAALPLACHTANTTSSLLLSLAFIARVEIVLDSSTFLQHNRTERERKEAQNSTWEGGGPKLLPDRQRAESG